MAPITGDGPGDSILGHGHVQCTMHEWHLIGQICHDGEMETNE